jgi:hypothetical protein
MPVEIDLDQLPNFPQRIPEKLRAIREHSKRSPDEFAAHVQAKDGAEITSYEDDTGELPVPILIWYARLASI